MTTEELNALKAVLDDGNMGVVVHKGLGSQYNLVQSIEDNQITFGSGTVVSATSYILKFSDFFILVPVSSFGKME